MAWARLADRSQMFNSPPSGVLAGFVVAAVLFSFSACSTSADYTGPSNAELAEQALLDDGVAPDVVDCVLRLGRRRLAMTEMAPAEMDELTATCEVARARLNGESADPLAASAGADATDAPSNRPHTFGDDPLLDALWTSCEIGTGNACDELFVTAPPDSEYERFGLSCGGREDVLHCVELDQLDAEGEPVPLLYREIQGQVDPAGSAMNEAKEGEGNRGGGGTRG